ncbi:MAG: hypothetical protein GY906_24365 [bacterium]|nr:hypothetical protein [bacterium]
MSVTNFPNGVSSFGNILTGDNFGLMGGRIAATGDAKHYYVDPANGSDGNTGLSPDKALDTVGAAYDKTVDKSGDVIHLLNDGNTSGTSRDNSTITWSNDNVHLVGHCAPTMLSQRARISPASTVGSIVTPQLNVTGNGNSFRNVALFEGDDQDATASVCVQVTGSRNYFWNVAMMNMGSANSGDEAASANLKLSGAEENTFERCYIGLDTTARSTTNANVELVSSSTRNFFLDCFFPMTADAATPMFIKIDAANDIDRFVYFRGCMFYNAIGSSATTINQVASIHAAAGGLVLLDYCSSVGATEWETTASTNLYLNMPIADSAEPAGGTMTVSST